MNDKTYMEVCNLANKLNETEEALSRCRQLYSFEKELNARLTAENKRLKELVFIYENN